MAEELGYTPDPMLSRLAAYRSGEAHAQTGTVLAVLTDVSGELHPAGRIRIEGARQRAAELGYGIEIHRVTDSGQNLRRLTKMLKARGIEGLLVDAVRQAGSYEGFPWQEFHPVAMGISMQSLPIPTVFNDLFASVREAWQFVQERGYERPGLVLRAEGMVEPNRMVLASGLVEQSMMLRKNVIPPFRPESEELSEKLSKRFVQWFERYRPDVCIGSDAVLRLARENGLSIPKDLAFVAFSLSRGQIGDPAVAGFHIDLEKAGRLAVELCHLSLERPILKRDSARVIHLIEPEWQEGNSLPVKPHQRASG